MKKLFFIVLLFSLSLSAVKHPCPFCPPDEPAQIQTEDAFKKHVAELHANKFAASSFILCPTIVNYATGGSGKCFLSCESAEALAVHMWQAHMERK